MPDIDVQDALPGLAAVSLLLYSGPECMASAGPLLVHADRAELWTQMVASPALQSESPWSWDVNLSTGSPGVEYGFRVPGAEPVWLSLVNQSAVVGPYTVELRGGSGRMSGYLSGWEFSPVQATPPLEIAVRWLARHEAGEWRVIDPLAIEEASRGRLWGQWASC